MVICAENIAEKPSNFIGLFSEFHGMERGDILKSLNILGLPWEKMMRAIAFCLEVGHYPQIPILIEFCEAAVYAEKNEALCNALQKFKECAELGLAYEKEYGPGAARNLSHPFWEEEWEPIQRLRASGRDIANYDPDLSWFR